MGEPGAPGPGDAVGPYTLVDLIGSGGMGEVWRAADGRPGADPAEVAVKLIREGRLDQPEARARFRREVEAAGRVDAPEVASVLDADPGGPHPWAATRFVAGPTLTERVTAGGPLGDDDLRALGLGLARGLEAIHGAGVVHRDLTPGNVVLGADGPVIIDFGVARVDDTTTITRAGSLVGTPAWMAPEQLRDEAPSDASDLWAWGAVMAFAATGRPPVAGDRTEAVITKVLGGDLDLDGLPGWLVPLVGAALDPDPARRPTADELVARIDRSGRGLAARAVTRADPVTEVAPAHVAPTAAGPPPDASGAAPSAEPTDPGRWRRLGVRALVIVVAAVIGAVVVPLLGVVLAAGGVLLAAGLRVWTQERPGDRPPTVNAATVLLASLVLLAAALSSVLGVVPAVVAVLVLVVVFLLLGGDLG